MDLLKSIEEYIIETRGELKQKPEGVAYHSKKVKPNDIYVAIKGFITDGHRFVAEAIANGAVALVVEDFVDNEIFQIRVTDSRKALSRLSAQLYKNPTKSLKVVGITATNGKTTTSFILEHILTKNNIKTGLIGSVITKAGNETTSAQLTTPESLELQELFSKMAYNNCEAAIMEVSSSALELSRVNDVYFDIVSFNNFSREHIDQHGSFEAYWNAKSSLIKNASKDTLAILNIDDERIRDLQYNTNAKLFTISLDSRKADLTCTSIKLIEGRANMNLNLSKEIILSDCIIKPQIFDISLKIPGYHSAENAIMAIAIALNFGIAVENIKNAIEEFKGVERRFEFIYEDDFIIIDDHFANIKNINSTLSSIEAMDKSQFHIIYAIRGNRGTTINTENAQVLLEWADKLGLNEIVATRSKGSVSQKDMVKAEEERAFLEVFKNSSIDVKVFDTIEEAVNEAIPKLKSKDILLLAGCQGMDRGADEVLKSFKGRVNENKLVKLERICKNRNN